MRKILALLLSLAPLTAAAIVSQGFVAPYAITAIESAASITVSQIDPRYKPGDALRYKVDMTGATDSTAQVIRAQSTGYVIDYPEGTVKVNTSAGSIAIPCGGIRGRGAGKTNFSDTDTGTNTTFAYSCSSIGGVFSDFNIAPATTKGGTAYAISVAASSFESPNLRVNNVTFTGYPNGINFINASQWVVSNSNFLNCTGDCITVNNTNNGDSGDSGITQTIFNNSTSTTAIAVHQLSSGGLRLTGDKFNNGGVGYELDLSNLANTSDLMIVGCSFENAHFSGIQLQRTAGTKVYTNVVISGNEFLVASSSNASTGIFSNNGALWLFTVAITGNTFQVSDTGASASAISVDYITDLLITGNVIRGSGGTATGISWGSHVVNAKMGLNEINQSLIGTTIQPSAVGQVVPSDFQSTTINVTTSTAQGALFNGTNTFTFPTAYDVSNPPTRNDCQATITGAGSGGGLSAYITAVTNTVATVAASSTTNGGVVPVFVSCRGTF